MYDYLYNTSTIHWAHRHRNLTRLTQSCASTHDCLFLKMVDSCYVVPGTILVYVVHFSTVTVPVRSLETIKILQSLTIVLCIVILTSCCVIETHL